MRKLKIPYRVVGAQSFFDRKEVRDVLAYAQVLAAPETDVPLLRILNTPNRGIGQASAVLATDWSRERSLSVWEALCHPEFTAELSGKVTAAIQHFSETVRCARMRLGGGENPGVALRALLDGCDYVPWLQRGCKTEAERSERAENVHEVLDQLTRHCATGRDLQSFLDTTALAGDREEDDLEKKSGVTLITLHASKGLEFPVVYLVGLEEGVLPHRRSIEEGSRDEERRLLYVGITRARESLTLSYCASRVKWGEQTACHPSSFLRELDRLHLLETSYQDIMGAEASDEELADFFGSVRASLRGK
jgi:superfamily I DNA/RNA helicase